MRQWILGLASLGWTLLVQTAVLADPVSTSSFLPDSLLARSKAVQFDLVLGRITVTAIRLGPNRSQATGDKESQRTETLSLGLQQQVPTVRYEMVDSQGKLIVDFSRSGDFLLHHVPAENEPRAEVSLQQPKSGALTLTTIVGGKRHELSASSLWHLWLEHPTLCREILTPLLEVLGPSFRLADDVDEVRQHLLRRASIGTIPDFHRVNELVLQLSSREFMRRQAAERELRAMGCAIVPHLQALDSRELDAEQRQRLHAIINGVRSPKSDTPERVAMWLTADISTWLILAADSDQHLRQLAAEQLQRLLARSIEYQPYADEPIRVEQLARLRKLILK